MMSDFHSGGLYDGLEFPPLPGRGRYGDEGIPVVESGLVPEGRIYLFDPSMFRIGPSMAADSLLWGRPTGKTIFAPTPAYKRPDSNPMPCVELFPGADKVELWYEDKRHEVIGLMAEGKVRARAAWKVLKMGVQDNG